MASYIFCKFVKTRQAIPTFHDVVNKQQTKKFVLPITEAKVIDVYDGDTVTIGFNLPGDNTVYRTSVRLIGIDCPEKKIPVKEQNLPHRISERTLNKIVTERVKELLLGKIVRVTDNETEMYGRLLANLHVDTPNGSICVSEILLKERMAVPYQGKKKNPPNDWMAYYEGHEEYVMNNSK